MAVSCHWTLSARKPTQRTDCSTTARIVKKEAQKNRSSRRKKEFNLYDFVCNANQAKLNPELAKFTPRQLQEELSARGFHGQLEFVMKAKL